MVVPTGVLVAPDDRPVALTVYVSSAAVQPEFWVRAVVLGRGRGVLVVGVKLLEVRQIHPVGGKVVIEEGHRLLVNAQRVGLDLGVGRVGIGRVAIVIRGFERGDRPRPEQLQCLLARCARGIQAVGAVLHRAVIEQLPVLEVIDVDLVLEDGDGVIVT